jgi:hypothetical protein
LKSWSRLTFATSFFSSSFTAVLLSVSGYSSLGFFCPVPRLINVFYLFTLWIFGLPPFNLAILTRSLNPYSNGNLHSK